MKLFEALFVFLIFQLDDFLLIPLAGVYITPSRVFVFFFFFYFVLRCLFTKVKSKGLSRFSLILICFLSVHIFSLFFSELGFSTLINYFVLDLFLILLISFSKILPNIIRYHKLLFYILFFFLILNIMIFIGSTIAVGFDEMLVSIYGRKMYGFYLERFYFSVFLILATHTVIILNKKKSPFIYFLIFLVSLCIIGSLSFTGILCLFTFFPYFFTEIKNKYLIPIILFLVIGSLFFLNSRKSFSTENELETIEAKADRYFSDNLYETNWRLFTSIILYDEFIKSPTLFGNGFRDNIFLLKFYNAKADDDKFVSSHTIISVLNDQGLIGFLLILSLFTLAVIKLIRYLLEIFIDAKRKSIYLFSCYFLITAHLLFYYQEFIPIFYILPIFLERDIVSKENESSLFYS